MMESFTQTDPNGCKITTANDKKEEIGNNKHNFPDLDITHEHKHRQEFKHRTHPNIQ